jgi:hypothetical protein
MTTRFKDFGEGGSTNKEPLSFKLHGEDFTCKPAVQGKVLLEIASIGSGNDPVAAANAMYGFFSSSMDEENYTRFKALLEDEEKIVTVETLGEIAGWLTEQYAGRPQSGPEQSASGQ